MKYSLSTFLKKTNWQIKHILIITAIGWHAVAYCNIDPKITFAAGISDLGASVAGMVHITDLYSLELGGNKFVYDGYKKELSNINYNLDSNLESIYLLGSIHPFRGSFRVSLGAFYNNNNLSITGRPNGDETITINGQRININQIGSVTGKITTQKINPYIGIGWGHDFNKTGFGVSFDLGALYWGKPKVTLTGSNIATQQIADDCRQEADNIEHKTKKYQFFPYVALKLYYRF